jgi:type II secretion system protein N
MKGGAALRWLGYIGFFLFCFVGSVYLTFPMDLLKPRILEEANRALNARKSPGMYGKPGSITIEEVKLWRVSGVELKNVVVTDVTTNPDPAPSWEIESVKVRLGILALLRKQLDIAFDVSAYDGSATGEILIAGEKFDQLKRIDAQANGIHWWKMQAVAQAMKVPGEGWLGGEVHLNLGKDIKEAAGDIKLAGEGLAVGPGELAIPMFGTLTIPRIDLGKLSGENIKVSEGKVNGPPITLTGVDFQGALDSQLQLRVPADQSQIVNGAASVKLAEPFLKANPRFQTAFDLAPQLKQAKAEDGSWRFKLRGTLGNPQGTPDKNVKVGTK